jgi:hypothetical protein
MVAKCLEIIFPQAMKFRAQLSKRVAAINSDFNQSHRDMKILCADGCVRTLAI